MKKIFTILIIALVLLLSLLSCDTPKTAETTDSQDSQTQNSGTIGSREECAEHSYSQWITVESSTCEKRGLRKRLCTMCGYEQFDETSLALHTKAARGKTEPTCTEGGATAGTYCSVCGNVINGCEPIPALGHLFKDGTCTDCGLVNKMPSVSVVLYSKETDSALKSALTACGFNVMVCIVSDIPMTEMDTDNADLYIFDGVMPKDMEVDKPAWYIDTQELPTQLGAYGEKKTSDSGFSLLTDTTNKTGKQVTNEITLRGASVGEYRELSLSGDGFATIFSVGQAPVMVAGTVNGNHVIVSGFTFDNSNLPLLLAGFPALVNNMVEYSLLGVLREAEKCKHTQQSVKGYDATCTEDGLSSGIVCSKCGEVLIPQEVKPAKGHKYGEDGVCTVCNEPKEE